MDNIVKKGHLEVPGGHQLYFEEWGNPDLPAIFYLHGGPGSNFSDSNKLLFNPKKHHVIFHDQRGCGRSIPHASFQNNTTQDLIEDINRLADYLNIETFSLVGGSWGSSLALLYTIAHPERIKRLLLWSIYLVRNFETEYVNEGHAKYYFPEAWERFIGNVPQENRKNGTAIMKYFAEKMRSENQETAVKYALEWTIWEATLLSLNYSPPMIEEMVVKESETAIAIALLETHYFLNHCFIPENYILDNVRKIAHIPCDIVHGRFDMCTPVVSAFDLQEAYGENASVNITIAGHLRTEPENFKKIKELARKNL